METSSDVTGPINLGNPGEFTIRELAEQVIAETNSESALVEAPLPEDDPHQRRPEIERAKELLKWSPRVELSEGLPNTLKYFRQLFADAPPENASA
jgi:UDP-glucuronate decarboxylase